VAKEAQNTSGEKRRKPFKEIFSTQLGYLLKAVLEAQVSGCFRFCVDLGRQGIDFLAGHILSLCLSTVWALTRLEQGLCATAGWTESWTVILNYWLTSL